MAIAMLSEAQDCHEPEKVLSNGRIPVGLVTPPPGSGCTTANHPSVFHVVEISGRYIQPMHARESALANVKWQLDLSREDAKRLKFLISCQSTTVETRTRAVTQLPCVRERIQALAQELKFGFREGSQLS